MITLVLAASLQTTWFVDAGGVSPGSGTAADPYTSIAFALDQPGTVSGDTVLVLPGTYSDEAIDFQGKNVALRSSSGSGSTRIDSVPFGPAPAPAIRIASGETGVVIEGFTITGDGGERGGWSAFPTDGVGGGLLCQGASATLRDVVIQGGENTFAGAGIFAQGAQLDLDAVHLERNGDPFTTNRGAGLYAEDSQIHWTRSDVVENEVDFRGAGAHLVRCTSVISRTLFLGGVSGMGSGMGITVEGGSLDLSISQFTSHFSGDAGGALLILDGAEVDVTACLFEGNSAGFADPYPGGAIRVESGSLRVADSVFEFNRGQFGGAISAEVPIEVENCQFRDNTASGAGQYGCFGGAIDCVAGTVISRSTFERNSAQDAFSDGGGAVFGFADIAFCTFVDNLANGGDPGAIGGAASVSNSIVRGSAGSVNAAAVTFSNVSGGAAGTGNFDADPGFWDPGADLRLLPGSPCIDTGDPLADLDQDGTRADVGAFAFDASVGAMIGATTCAANANSTGQPATLVARGSEIQSDDRVTLHVTGVPSGSLGYILTSKTPGMTMLGAGSQGVLCLGGNVLRFSASVIDDRGTDVVSFHPRLNMFPQGTTALAGETWIFQHWFRDANPGPTSNTSSAVGVMLQ